MVPVLALALAACAPSVIPAFEQARDDALADPGPVPERWEPDAILTIAPEVVDRALDRVLAVHGEVDSTVRAGPLSARPVLRIRSVELRPARCRRCVRAIAALRGRVEVDTPLGAVAAPASGRLDLDVELGLAEREGRQHVVVRPRRIHDVEIDVAGVDLGAFTQPVARWLDAVVAAADEVPLVALGGDDLPLRAMAVRLDGGDLRLSLLTASPTPVPVAEPDGSPGDGWRLDIATDALLDLARAAAFRADPLPRDLVAEPTALSIDGDRFELGLRLWRVKGRGWWRDYAVTGRVEVLDRRIALTPERVEPVGHSPGAGWIDPVAALGRPVIVRSLQRALDASVPAVYRERGEELRLVVTLASIEGRGAVVVTRGALAVEAR